MFKYVITCSGYWEPSISATTFLDLAKGRSSSNIVRWSFIVVPYKQIKVKPDNYQLSYITASLTKCIHVYAESMHYHHHRVFAWIQHLQQLLQQLELVQYHLLYSVKRKYIWTLLPFHVPIKNVFVSLWPDQNAITLHV